MARRKNSQKTGPRRMRETGETARREPPQKQRSDNDSNDWIYGTHAGSAALANPMRNLQRILVTHKTAESLGDYRGTPSPEIVGAEEIEAHLPPGAVHQGLAVLAAPLAAKSLNDIAAAAKNTDRCLILALDQVTDPQNVGAALRSAAAFGALAVVVPDRNTPPATGALAKAASGAVETVALARVNNLVRALEELKTEGFWVVGLDMNAPATLPGTDLPKKCVFTLGAEGKGLRRLTRETCDLMVSVPMTGDIESLNVSASAAVALYEWHRQGIAG